MNKTKRIISLFLIAAMFIINVNVQIIKAADDDTVTITFVDKTDEQWIANDNACIELVDNTKGHDKYIMKKVDDVTWQVEVPEAAYNITFNRLSADKSEQWNSWSAGGRDGKVCYYAESHSYGEWIETETEGFKEGDVIYLDLNDFTNWKNDDAKLYANFTKASKNDNYGADIYFPNADKKLFNPQSGLVELQENLYYYVVTEKDAGSNVLRFWRGNEDTLWNYSVYLTYKDYKDGYNCINVFDWNDQGCLSKVNGEDLDNDGVTNDIEELFNTDPLKSDTDEDGLSDYIEIYITGTDPTLKDTDGNGVNDGDEDSDEDGLTNLEEIKLNTDLNKKDTDNDNLSDYDEVNVYKCNPLNPDTDGDGICDGDEILLGLDPLVTCSDGVTLDSERTFDQKLDTSNIDSELLEDNELIPSISGNVTGNINRHISVESEDIYALNDNRAVVGKEVYIDTDYEEGADVQLHFDCSSELEKKELLIICKYDEGKIIPCETNVTENDIWTNVSTGYYFVMDSEKFLGDIDISLDEYKNKITEAAPCAELEEESYIMTDDMSEPTAVAEVVEQKTSKIYGQADIVFLIDSTGSMGGAINNVVKNIGTFVDTLTSKYSVKVNFALVDYKDITCKGEETKLIKNGTSNWFTDVEQYKNCIKSIRVTGGGDGPETSIDALGMANELDYRKNANKFIILVTDADYKVNNNYGIASMDEITNELASKEIVTSVISAQRYEPRYHDLYTITNGVFGNIYANFSDVLLSLADKIGGIVNDGSWVILSDYQYVKLNKPVAADSGDTDEDSVSDYEELGEAVEQDITPFLKVVLNAYGVPYELYDGQTSIEVYNYKSNPIIIDTDFDGINDDEDSKPKNNKFAGRMHYRLDDKNKECDVEFSVDYRNLFKDNTKYSKDLAVLTSLYASDIYDNLYIEVKDGAKGGSDDATEFGKIFGLQDVEDIKIKGANYTVDKDDQTEFVIGHRTVEYNGEKREVIVLTVRGTNGTSAEWSSNFDVGADTTEYYDIMGSEHPDWKNKLNHKGFDVATNRILDKFNDYITRHGLNDSSIEKSILISGHSRGAAIANLLGAHFENDADYQSYTYTFAAPYSTTDSNASSYKTINNIVNKDDIIPYLPLEKWGFYKYGTTKEISVADNYENKWGKAEEGTWEWLIGQDYDNDGGMQRTLKCFEAVADNREELYKLDTSDDGKVNIGNKYHTTKAGANKRLEELQKELDEYKLGKFCDLSVKKGALLYHVEVNYCPAYLMQNLANMACGFGPMLGYDVKGVYAKAKASFALSSGNIPITHLGGMTHPHMQPTYYLLARNNFKAI